MTIYCTMYNYKKQKLVATLSVYLFKILRAFFWFITFYPLIEVIFILRLKKLRPREFRDLIQTSSKSKWTPELSFHNYLPSAFTTKVKWYALHSLVSMPVKKKKGRGGNITSALSYRWHWMKSVIQLLLLIFSITHLFLSGDTESIRTSNITHFASDKVV